MRFYRTSQVIESIRQAHAEHRHVHVHRDYTNLRPIIVKTTLLKDLPVFLWSQWQKESQGQLDRWKEEGGILLNRGRNQGTYIPSDAMVFFECPLSVHAMEIASAEVRHDVVVPCPHTWAQHQLTIDLLTPEVETLQLLWSHCGSSRMTDAELAERSGVPKNRIMFFRRSLRPEEEWEISLRILPYSKALQSAWNWVNEAVGGKTLIATKSEVRSSGHRVALKEMHRLGHVEIQKHFEYKLPPRWETLSRQREKAIADLDRIRSLVESLPDYLQDR